MVRDDDLLTGDLSEALGRAAEPLSDDARAAIKTHVMGEVRASRRGSLIVLASHRVAAAATAFAVLGSGVAYAADRSLPGDPLYGVKIAAENAAVSILPPGRLENRVLVGIAARRAAETARLARKGSEPEAVEESLGALREAVRQATPAEGTLGEEEAHRIREHGADAPVQTREAIDDAVSSPGKQGTTGGSGGQESPYRGDDSGTEAAPYREFGQQDTSGSTAPTQSGETSGSPGSR